MKRLQIPKLHPAEYEHRWDREALDAVEGTPGLEFTVKKFLDLGLDRELRLRLTGSYFQVTQESLPELHALFLDTCRTLAMPGAPELYVVSDDSLDAFTAGASRPLVAVNSGAVDVLSEDELVFILGHELGHIKSNHVLYHTLGSAVGAAASVLGSATFGFGELVTAGLQFALAKWKRVSEFTADRAGLLACQDVNVAASALMKLAGLPKKYYSSCSPSSFLKQASDFQKLDYGAYDRVLKIILEAGDDHPWTVMRAKELCSWIGEDHYKRVLLRETAAARGNESLSQPFCARCETQLADGQKFCSSCGQEQ